MNSPKRMEDFFRSLPAVGAGDLPLANGMSSNITGMSCETQLAFLSVFVECIISHSGALASTPPGSFGYLVGNDPKTLTAMFSVPEFTPLGQMRSPPPDALMLTSFLSENSTPGQTPTHRTTIPTHVAQAFEEELKQQQQQNASKSADEQPRKVSFADDALADNNGTPSANNIPHVQSIVSEGAKAGGSKKHMSYHQAGGALALLALVKALRISLERVKAKSAMPPAERKKLSAHAEETPADILVTSPTQNFTSRSNSTTAEEEQSVSEYNPIIDFVDEELPTSLRTISSLNQHSMTADLGGAKTSMIFGSSVASLPFAARYSSPFLNTSVRGENGEVIEEDVSTWLKDTFTADNGTGKRLGKGKEGEGKRSVTRMSETDARRSLSHTIESDNSTPHLSGPLPPSTSAPDSPKQPRKATASPWTTKGQNISRENSQCSEEGNGTPTQLPSSNNRQETRQTRRSHFVAFADSTDEHKDTSDPTTRENSSSGDAAVTGDGHESKSSNDAPVADPFAGIQSLHSGPTEHHSDDEDEEERAARAARSRSISRRSSQYFRRQSLILSPSAMAAANEGTTTTSSGQTLHTTDVIELRLSVLGAPWLDVDSHEFDIFEACRRVDSGELRIPAMKNPQSPSQSFDGEQKIVVTSPLSSDHMFSYVCLNVFLRYSFVDNLKIDLKKLFNFFRAVEQAYQPQNPYHNALHAADVLQTSHIYLLTNNVYENFFDREILCLLLAALVHDVGHLGVNNQFLIKIHHPVAILYNGLSPLENMHSLIALRLLEQADFNFLAASDVWSQNDTQELANKVVEMVIATDMKFHQGSVALATEMFADGFQVGDGDIDKLIKMIIHAADLSNPMKPRAVYHNWLQRVVAEFFSQGAAEAAFSLPISPNFDRKAGKVPEMQVGFINFVVKPYAKALAEVLPAEWLQRLDRNLEEMQSLCGKPYDQIDVILNYCAQPWVDPWVKVAPYLQLGMEHLVRLDSLCAGDSVLQVPSKQVSTSFLFSASMMANDGRDYSHSHVATADAAVMTEELVPTKVEKPEVPVPQPVVVVAKRATVLSEVRTRFSLGVNEATQSRVKKVSEAAATGAISKLAIAEEQRAFALLIVRQIIKFYYQLRQAVEAADLATDDKIRTVHAMEQLKELLSLDTVNTMSESELLRLDSNASVCLQLMKKKWVPLQHEHTVGRYTPRGKEENAFTEIVRQCTQMFLSVIDNAANLTASMDKTHLLEQQLSLGAMMVAPSEFAVQRGRNLYGGFGHVHTPLNNGRGMFGVRNTQVVPMDEVPFDGRYSAPLFSSAQPWVSPARSHQLPPLAKSVPSAPPQSLWAADHLPQPSAWRPRHDCEPQSEDVRIDNGEEDVLPVPIEESQIASPEYENNAQIHFQHPLLAKRGSWRPMSEEAKQSGSGSPASLALHNSFVKLPPSLITVRPATMVLHVDNNNGAVSSQQLTPFIEQLGPNSSTSFEVETLTTRPLGETPFGANAIPTYLAQRGNALSTSTDVEQRKSTMNAAFGAQVQSVDCSPRCEVTPNTAPLSAVVQPAPMTLHHHPSSSTQDEVLSETEAHNLLQLEYLLLHHPLHSQAVTNVHQLSRHSSGFMRSSQGAAEVRLRSASPTAVNAVENNDLGSSSALPAHSPGSFSLGGDSDGGSVGGSPSRRRPIRFQPQRGPVVTEPPTLAASPSASTASIDPVYRQQLAEMIVGGMETRTFGSGGSSAHSSRHSSPTNHAVSIANGSPLPRVTSEQLHQIEEGVPVPEVYRATSFRRAP